MHGQGRGAAKQKMDKRRQGEGGGLNLAKMCRHPLWVTPWKVWQLHTQDVYFEGQIYVEKASVHTHECSHCLLVASK